MPSVKTPVPPTRLASVSAVAYLSHEQLAPLRLSAARLDIELDGKRYVVTTDAIASLKVCRVDQAALSFRTALRELFTHRLADGSFRSRSTRLHASLARQLKQPRHSFATRTTVRWLDRVQVERIRPFTTTVSNPPAFNPARTAQAALAMPASRAESIASRNGWVNPTATIAATRCDVSLDDMAGCARIDLVGAALASLDGADRRAAALHVIATLPIAAWLRVPDDDDAARLAWRDAWHVAGLLAATRHGFEQILAVRTPGMHEQPPARPQDLSPEQEAFWTLLQVAGEFKLAYPGGARAENPLTLMHPLEPPTPDAPDASARESTGKLHWLGHAAARHAAGMLGTTAATAATAPQDVSAYFAWRQGFRHDGPGTDFARVKHRLFKFRTWTQRARDAERDGKRGDGKTPLPSLRHGLMGADLPPPMAQRHAFDAAYRAAIDHLGRDTEWLLAERWRADDEPGRLRWRVRLALLRFTAEASGEIHGALRIDKAVAGAVAARLATANEGTDANAMTAVADATMTWQVLRGEPLLTPELLEDWSRDLCRLHAALPRVYTEARRAAEDAWRRVMEQDDDPPSGQADAEYRKVSDTRSTPAHHHAFNVACRCATTLFQGGLRRLDGGVDAMLGTLIDVAYGDSVRIGNRVSFVDGRQRGIILQGNLPIPGTPVHLGPDVAMLHRRVARLDVGSTSMGGIFVIGSEQQAIDRCGARAGVGVGVTAFDDWLSVSATAGVALTSDALSGDAVVVRMPTRVAMHAGVQAPGKVRGRYGDAWRPLAKDFGAFMAGAEAAAYRNADDMFDALARRFVDTTLSIGLQTTSTMRQGSTLGLSAQARVVVGPNAALQLSHQAKVTSHVAESSGTLRATISMLGGGTCVSARAGLSSRTAAVGVLHAAAALPMLLGGGATLHDGRFERVVRLAYRDAGTVDHEFSILDMQFHSGGACLAYLHERAHEIKAMLSPDAATAEATFDACITDIEALAGGTDFVFSLRSQLTEAAAQRISQRYARLAMLRAGTDVAPARDGEGRMLAQEIARILEAPACWRPCQVLGVQSHGSERQVGVNLVVHRTGIDGAAAVRRHLTYPAWWWVRAG